MGSSSELHFRHAELSDIGGLKALYSDLIPDASLSDSHMESDLLAVLKLSTKCSISAARTEILVGTLSSQLICTCQIVVFRNLVRSPRQRGLIESIIVSRDFRRRGIGSRMVNFACARMRQMGCGLITISSAFHREEARVLFGRLGFVDFGYSYLLPV